MAQDRAAEDLSKNEGRIQGRQQGMNNSRKPKASVRKQLIVVITLILIGAAVLAVAYPMVAQAGGGALAGY
ncbi:MAG TPA: hypothetical protein VGL56_20535 [Fimbriimonadaceae bacterium]